MPDRFSPARRRTWLGLAVLFTLALPVLGAPFGADPEAASALLEQLSDRFEVLTLSDSYVLQPTDPDADFRSIEVKANTVAVDSERVSRLELEELIGADAEMVFALSELGSAEWSATEELRRRIERMAQERRLEVGEIEDLVRSRVGEIENLRQEHLEAIEDALEDQRRAERHRRRSRRGRRVRTDTRVSFGSSLTIEEDETAQDVVVLGGSLDLDGEVRGDAVVIGGSAEVGGEVSGTLTVVGGSVFLGPEAKIYGDVMSFGGSVHRDSSAEIYGEITEVSLGPDFDVDDLWPGIWIPSWHFGLFDFGLQDLLVRVSKTAILTVLLLLLVLLFPTLITAVAECAERQPWKAGMFGLGAQLFFLFALPVLCIILMITVIGIPLALILAPLATLVLVVFFFLGFAGVAMAGGRLLQRRFEWWDMSPYLLVLLGIVLIQGWSILGEALGFLGGPIKFLAWAMLMLGFLVKYIAWTVGLGAILLHRFSPRPLAPALPPPPPSDPSGWEDTALDKESEDPEVDADEEYLRATDPEDAEGSDVDPADDDSSDDQAADDESGRKPTE